MEEMVKKVLMILLGGGLVVGLSLPALAVSSVELHKLTASDAAVWDEFGFSVALSGATALVGAPGNDDACPDEPGCESGSAYLYDFSDPCNIIETKLTASYDEDYAKFGFSVAISSSTAIVGEPYDDDPFFSGRWGSAYLFDVTTGNQLFKLTASDAAGDDEFGFSVAISDTTALVGAPYDDDGGSSTGSAYLFDVSDPCNPIETCKLTASDAAAWDGFGWSVALSGNTALVGAPWNDDTGNDSGSAYLFDVATGIQLAKLSASDTAWGDYFGHSVAISSSTVLVGAFGNYIAGHNAGSAYLFDVADRNNPVQIARLTASDTEAYIKFGYSVAISGTTALVGAPYEDDECCDSGSAYLYDFSDPCNIIETKLTASDAAVWDEFGFSVALSGATAIMGAVGNDDAGSNSGSAYLFRFCLFPPVGDINLDCRVDLTDFARFAPNWIDTACGACGGADLTDDGNVGLDDLREFTDNWLVDCILDPSDPACLAP